MSGGCPCDACREARRRQQQAKREAATLRALIRASEPSYLDKLTPGDNPLDWALSLAVALVAAVERSDALDRDNALAALLSEAREYLAQTETDDTAKAEKAE